MYYIREIGLNTNRMCYYDTLQYNYAPWHSFELMFNEIALVPIITTKIQSAVKKPARKKVSISDELDNGIHREGRCHPNIMNIIYTIFK